MWGILRFFFFKLDAEHAHYLAMDLLSFALKIPLLNIVVKNSFQFKSEKLKTEFCGMTADNAIGLAAGFDKDGQWLNVLASLGFGHIEVGTVTPLSQEGNPKPRLFRLLKDRSIINRMGFNNSGARLLANKLRTFKKPPGLIIGANIGKNKITPVDQAKDDYLICFKILVSYVDYFTINVSSPNTPGLRQLQDKVLLSNLLSQLQEENKKQDKPKPLFLKIAPDLNNESIDDIIEVVLRCGINGIVISNTTIDRPSGLIEKEIATESGGLSGAALTEKADQTLNYIHTKAGDSIGLIGVGGIMNTENALDRIASGASWIQIYTGMIYEGPWFIKKLKQEIAKNYPEIKK